MTPKEEKHTEVDDELSDLQACDVLLPPDLDATSALEVVPVHDDMDRQVEGNDGPLDGGRANQLGVAQEGGSTVVVAVEES